MEPIYLLLIGILLLGIFVFLLWPEFGLVWRWKRNKQNNSRVLIEDSLKHIYDCEYNNLNCTLNSIIGTLHVSTDRGVKILSALEEMELIYFKNELIYLTDEGRSYALRVIRIHRLWERYLADETSFKETDWHSNAEDAEHKLTEEEANKLAAQMGNPFVDPHGDPIPSADGEIIEKRGISLSQLAVGNFGRIVHIEDEPKTIFSQIVASGLHNGMEIKLVESSQNRLKLIGEGNEILLSPLFASNISVIPIDAGEELKENYKSLSSLNRGEKAVVMGISRACRGQQRRRLMDLGIVKGTKIKYALESAGKDPIAYEVRGATVALRKSQSDLIFIKKDGE